VYNLLHPDVFNDTLPFGQKHRGNEVHTYLIELLSAPPQQIPLLRGFILQADDEGGAVTRAKKQLATRLAVHASVVRVRTALPGDEMYVYSTYGGDCILRGTSCED
jgi:hypothetical protein